MRKILEVGHPATLEILPPHLIAIFICCSATLSHSLNFKAGKTPLKQKSRTRTPSSKHGIWAG
jgi:hypothetical protein